MATDNKTETNVKRFILKRIFRIYPTFLLVWFVLMAICFNALSFHDSMRSLFLFHIDYTAPAPGFKYNKVGPAWTLTYEIYFYFIFMLSFMLSHKYRGLLASFILLALPVILQFVFNGMFSPRADASADIQMNAMYYAPVAVLSCTMIWEFAVGILLAFLWKAYGQVVLSANTVLVCLISGIFFLVFLYFVFGDVKLMQGVTGFLLPSICVFISFLIIGNKGFRVIKPLVFLGDISYSIYLIHWPLMLILSVYFPGWGFMLPKPLNLIVYLFVVFLISVIVHHFIEKPSLSVCNKILANREFR